jgi:energy-converting hydrogenase Eha subunit C
MPSTRADQLTFTESKTMSTTQQILAEFREIRLKQKAEEARWENYRREANPPWPIVIALVFVGLAGMLVAAAYLRVNPHALRSPFCLLIIPVAGLLQLVVKLAQRREKALALAIKEEAPELYEKLKAEQLVR